jgi:hypothetical protein
MLDLDDAQSTLPDPSGASYEPTPKARRGKQGVPCATYPEVLASLSEDDGARVDVLARFKAAGGNRDLWQRRDREIMADALSRAEDALELRASRAAAVVATLAKVHAVRRRLERELWA